MSAFAEAADRARHSGVPAPQTLPSLHLELVTRAFGEAFRRLSWADVGPRAILSRAVAGTFAGKVVVALPGSPAALALAVEQMLAPVLPHAAALASGRGNHH